jgi:aspartyl-tRNA(Asn)/glutamyl-tRNA(Gln) amidotransferase subunit A
MLKINKKKYNLLDLYRSIRDRSLSPIDIAEKVIENYSNTKSSLNAYREFDPDKILNRAKAVNKKINKSIDCGKLMGIPISIKDLYGVNGYKTYAGTPSALPIKWEAEGPVVKSTQKQCALITGKTHTVEFAFGGLGINPHWGTPINPWDSKNHRVPGGSSAGAGVSLETGTAMIALGSDTAGSVRIPASITGNDGLKTTVGRWSTYGIVPLSTSLDTAGILTNTVEDLFFSFLEINKHSKIKSKININEINNYINNSYKYGLVDWFFEECDPYINKEILKVFDKISSRNQNKITAIQSSEIKESHALFLKGGLAASEFGSFINNEMIEFKKTLDPNVAYRIKDISSFPAIEYIKRVKELEVLSNKIHLLFNEIDFLLSPTIIISAPKVADLVEVGAYSKANSAFLRNTSPINLLGLCAVTIPVALDNNQIPIGLQIIGAKNKEEEVMIAARSIENIIGNKYQSLKKDIL